MLTNTTQRPIPLRLKSGEIVNLMPGEAFDFSSEDLENPIIQELVRTGELKKTD